MKTKIKEIIIVMSLIAAMGLLLNSCVNESLELSDNKPLVTTGKVRIPLMVNMPDREQVQTRSDDEFIGGRMYVLVFDRDDILCQIATVDITPEGNINSYTVELEASGGHQCTIYVVANVPELNPAISPLPLGTTIEEMIKILATHAFTGGLLHSGFINYSECTQPMISEPLILPEGISSRTVINKAGTGEGAALDLIRAMAKITIAKGSGSNVNTASLSRFTLLGASLGNVPVQGYMLPSAKKREKFETGYYSKSDQQGLSYNNLPVGAFEDGSETLPLYCYESATDNNSYVVIKASYDGGVSGEQIGYYKIALFKSGTQMALTRNTWYKVIIKKVLSYGYATAEEAITNQAANIEANIVVTDSNSHDIISNGQYYLGVSNSEYVVYEDGQLSNLNAVTVTTDAPNSVTTRTVSVSGGISTSNLTLGPSTDIIINIPDGIDEGSITFSVGNLTKKVKVTRKQKLHAAGEPLLDFAGAEYVKATMVGTPFWLQFATDIFGTNASSDVTNPSGGIYVLLNRNVDISSSPTDAEAYFSRRNNMGRVKARFTH